MEKAPRGSILVVSTGGFVAGYWGEVLTVAAEAAGIAALVIDGGVRDIAALTARRFPAFSRGISVRGTIKASVPSVGQPLSFTGTPVAAGDLVVAWLSFRRRMSRRPWPRVRLASTRKQG
ncbi:4-hydroxy-4-methyl-2-oxoglutarate aldolase [compost metagenome]